MKNLFILLFVALLGMLVGVFNQLYLLSNEENIWYVFGACMSGVMMILLIVYAYAEYRREES